MPPQRIVIVGCSGSGKSTLARELGRRRCDPCAKVGRAGFFSIRPVVQHIEMHNWQSETHRGDAWIIDCRAPKRS
jgi:ABC-type phosphate/phosphonate transport system ATPase subunit